MTIPFVEEAPFMEESVERAQFFNTVCLAAPSGKVAPSQHVWFCYGYLQQILPWFSPLVPLTLPCNS